MSEVAVAGTSLEERVVEALREGLGRLGIPAEVEAERVPDVEFSRVYVTAPAFANLWYSERQDLVWRILDEHFSRDEQFHISGIHTMTPDELEGNA